MNNIHSSSNRVNQGQNNLPIQNQQLGSMAGRSVAPAPAGYSFLNLYRDGLYHRDDRYVASQSVAPVPAGNPPPFNPIFHPPEYQPYPAPPAFDADQHVQQILPAPVDLIDGRARVHNWGVDYEGGEYRNAQNPLFKLTFARGSMADRTPAKAMAVKDGERRFVITQMLGKERLTIQAVDRQSWNSTDVETLDLGLQGGSISRHALTPILRDILYSHEADALSDQQELRESTWFRADHLVNQFLNLSIS